MLEGYLVDLVPFGKTFLDMEHKWLNNESTFWSGGGEWRIVTKAQVEARHRQWAEERERRGDQGVSFGIQTKDGVPLGYIGINWLHPTYRLGLLGARIGEPDYWGGGYGTDALLLLLEYGFDWLDLRKAWLLTTSMNARVMRQMEKVGFTLEGRQRQSALAEGEWFDWIVYGMLREEWPGREVLVEKLGLRERAASVYEGR